MTREQKRALKEDMRKLLASWSTLAFKSDPSWFERSVTWIIRNH